MSPTARPSGSPSGGPSGDPASAAEPIAAAVSEREFRTAMGEFATGITVVTATHDGVDHAMTANAFTSVSLAPPLVSLCVERTTRFHGAVTRLGATWGVSILGASGQAAAAWFATKGRPLEGQLNVAAHHRGARTGSVLLDDALATLECRTRAVYPGGDHDIVLADVVAASTASPSPSDERAEGADAAGSVSPPLLYFRGGYRELPTDV